MVDKNLRTWLNYQIRNYGPQDACSLTEIAKFGVMRTPAVVDGGIVVISWVATVAESMTLLRQ